MRSHRKIAWDITTFDGFLYIDCIDRFVHRDDPKFGELASNCWTSTHSRRFRTKAKMLKFLNSDVRCPIGGAEGWIVMRIVWKGGRVLTGEYAVMKKPSY